MSERRLTDEQLYDLAATYVPGGLDADVTCALNELRDLRSLLATVTAHVDAVDHDLDVLVAYRDARNNGGQHVGTGGPLASANPSTFAYLRRFVRDIRAALQAKGGAK